MNNLTQCTGYVHNDQAENYKTTAQTEKEKVMKREQLYKLYEQYKNVTPIGTYTISNWDGLEILDIQYGIEDYVIASFNFSGVRQMIRRHKICYTTAGRAYIRKQGIRFYLDEIMRI